MTHFSCPICNIARAVERLRKNFNQPLRMKSIAQELGMSVSGFHHHFKSVTAMSPLQFGENLDATSAAYMNRVGRYLALQSRL